MCGLWHVLHREKCRDMPSWKPMSCQTGPPRNCMHEFSVSKIYLYKKKKMNKWINETEKNCSRVKPTVANLRIRRD